jgi:hypothetical protein
MIEGQQLTVVSLQSYIATQAAQWGADQELEACCKWLSFYSAASDARDLRIARRPKPPSLKEQAGDLARIKATLSALRRAGLDAVDENTIRRALEALDD